MLDCIADSQQTGQLPAGDPLPMAFLAWSLVHGIAKLAIGGNLPMDAAAAIEFTRLATRQMVDGLGAGALGPMARGRA